MNNSGYIIIATGVFGLEIPKIEYRAIYLATINLKFPLILLVISL